MLQKRCLQIGRLLAAGCVMPAAASCTAGSSCGGCTRRLGRRRRQGQVGRIKRSQQLLQRLGQQGQLVRL